MKHTAPAISCIEWRHCSHTGSREIPSKGSLQIRQLEGNKVAKRLSAMPRSESASRFFCPKKPTPAIRIGSPLLLKTTLPKTSGTNLYSIRFGNSARNARSLSSNATGYVRGMTLAYLYKYPLVASAKAIGTTNCAHTERG